MFKKVVLFLVLILVVGLAIMSFVFKKDLVSLFKTSNDFIANDPGVGSIKRDVEVAKDRIFTTNDPLRVTGEVENQPGKLSIKGVIRETNAQRELINLNSLKESSALNKSAALKVDDMFKKQYFEHLSPTGQGPSDLAKQANYDFVIIGENLALGNFKDDKELVDAWMASPGHRENILRNGYEEIGVAVKQGMFEGQMTWLAVQEFGTPSSSCPKPDAMLAQLLDNNKLELTKEELVINEKKAALDAFPNKNSSEYAALTTEYNSLVERYNALVGETKLKVGEYNSQAQAYNDCLQKTSTSK